MTALREAAGSVFVDPVRRGRLRLDGLPAGVRQLSITGLLGLVAVLASLVGNDLWRRGRLTLVEDVGPVPALLPVNLLAFTMASLALAWVLLLWGAALARWAVAVGVAVAFLIANASLAGPATSALDGDPLAFRAAGPVIRSGYFAAPVLVLVLVVLRAGGWDRRWARGAVAGAMVAAVAACFGGQLWLYREATALGRPPVMPLQLNAVVDAVQGLLLPLFILAVGALVQLGHRIARATVAPFGDVRARTARVAVLVLAAVKLRVALADGVGPWVDYVRERTPQAAQAVAFLGCFAVLGWALRRRRAEAAAPGDAWTETAIAASAALVASTIVLTTTVTGVTEFFLVHGPAGVGRWLARNVSLSGSGRYGLLLAAVPALAVGLLLLGRGRMEAGLFVTVLAAWAVPNLLLQQVLDRSIGFRTGFLDLLLTLGVVGYLAARWRHVDARAAVGLGGLLVFASLVAGNGYLLARALARFTPPGVVLIVVGVVYVLVADSSFTSGDSPRFPRETRTLLWVGYLLFTVTVANYALASRLPEYRVEFDRFGFHFLALPLAAWFAVRWRFRDS